MKYIITLGLLISATVVSAQAVNNSVFVSGQVAALAAIDTTTHAIRYTAVVPVEKASQEVLFGRASAWFATPQATAHEVLRAAEPDAGIVVGQGVSEVILQGLGEFTYPRQLFYTVKLQVKPGRYKYELTDFYFLDYPTRNSPRPEPEPAEKFLVEPKPNSLSRKRVLSHRAQLQRETQRLITSITAAMNGDGEW
jgi:hypothetical protein